MDLIFPVIRNTIQFLLLQAGKLLYGKNKESYISLKTLISSVHFL